MNSFVIRLVLNGGGNVADLSAFVNISLFWGMWWLSTCGAGRR